MVHGPKFDFHDWSSGLKKILVYDVNAYWSIFNDDGQSYNFNTISFKSWEGKITQYSAAYSSNIADRR